MLRSTRTGSLQCDRMAVAHSLGVAMTGGGGGRPQDWQLTQSQVLGHSVPEGHSVSVSLTCKHQAEILPIKLTTASLVSARNALFVSVYVMLRNFVEYLHKHLSE